MQVDALLRGLGIEPSTLPARAHDMHGAAPAFNAAWANAQQPQQPGVAAHHAAAAAAHHAAASAAARTAGGTWATEFSSSQGDAWAQQFTAPLRDALPDVTRHHAAHAAHAPGATWAREFAATAQAPPGIAWAEQFLGTGSSGAEAATAAQVDTASAWADEFSERAAARHGESAQDASRRLAGVLQDDPEGKFQGSQFLQFLSKMSHGEAEYQVGGGTQEGPVAAGDWAHEFSSVDPAVREAGIAARRNLAAGPGTGAVAAGGLPGMRGAGAAMEESWAEEFTAAARGEANEKATDAAFADAWASQFEREGVDEWVKDFQGMQARMVLPARQHAFMPCIACLLLRLPPPWPAVCRVCVQGLPTASPDARLPLPPCRGESSTRSASWAARHCVSSRHGQCPPVFLHELCAERRLLSACCVLCAEHDLGMAVACRRSRTCLTTRGRSTAARRRSRRRGQSTCLPRSTHSTATRTLWRPRKRRSRAAAWQTRAWLSRQWSRQTQVRLCCAECLCLVLKCASLTSIHCVLYVNNCEPHGCLAPPPLPVPPGLLE